MSGKKPNLNRRSFVKWAGIAGAGLATAGSASAHGGHDDDHDKPECDVKFHNDYRRVVVRAKKTVTVRAYTKRAYKGGHVVEKETDHFDCDLFDDSNYFTKVKVFHKDDFVTEKRCPYEDRRPDCDIDFYNDCRSLKVECDEKVTVKAYTRYEHEWGGRKIEKKRKEFDWTLHGENYFTHVKVYHKGRLVARKRCERERKGKPKYDIDFSKDCRRVRVKANRKVTIKAYTRHEHDWGGDVLTRRTKKFKWTLDRDNRFTKVKIYYKGELIGKKRCEKRKRKYRPDCDIDFYNNCRSVRVKCDEKVTIKAYTKHDHKWGGDVIRRRKKKFDWTVGKYNYFTFVKVLYKGQVIAVKKCDREKRKRPACDVDFYNDCRSVRVKCDRKVTIKAYTRYEHRWGDRKIQKKTKDFDWTLGKNNYFTEIKVYYKGELLLKQRCKPEYRKHHDRDKDDKHHDRHGKPDCDIEYRKGYRRVVVKTSVKVTVKAYTSEGDMVVNDGVKRFDGTLKRRSHYEKVEVYRKGKMIASRGRYDD